MFVAGHADDFVHVERHRVDIGVVEQDALGPSGGSGGVDDERDVVAGGARGGEAGALGDAGAQLRHSKHDGAGEACFGGVGGDVIFGDDEPRRAVLHLVGGFVRGERGVQWRDGRSDPPCGADDREQFDAVGQERGHDVSALHAVVEELGGDRVDLLRKCCTSD